MKFIPKLVLIVFVLFLLMPSRVLADGMVIEPDPFSNRWDYSNEINQQVLINYENGIQKMIVSIGLENTIKNKAVWIFPVPADPNRVVIDNLSEIPRLNGREISSAARSNLQDIQQALHFTQIYPAFYYALFGSRALTSSVSDAQTLSLGVETKTSEQDVQVYEHLEKEGISTEIVTAKTATGLFDYLKKQNLNIEKGTIPVLDEYIGKDYTFVVSWLTPQSIITTEPMIMQDQIANPNFPSSIRYPYQYAQKGVAVNFPTDKMYFPLKPTSVYNSKVVPATIKVIGYVSPEVFNDIKSYTQTDYYNEAYYYSGTANNSTLSNFINAKDNLVKYTRIKIDAPSKLLTEDLWIKNQAPIKTNYISFWASDSGIILFIIGGLLLLISSFISSILAGIILFKEWRNIKGFWKFGLTGLFNFLTIFGFIVATIIMRSKPIKPEDQPAADELKAKGYPVSAIESRDGRKFVFILLFTVFFMLISWGIVNLIMLTV